jgi:hypothetical protein
MFTPENTDQAAGYEIGRKLGRKRSCGRIIDREPPEHFNGSRRAQWRIGYDAGLRERRITASRARDMDKRITVAVWIDPANGSTRSKTYRGRVDRDLIMNDIAAKGVCGDVLVSCHDGDQMISEHRCGI